ncbi:flavin reductase family protein [Sphingomonas sp.]
MARLVFEGLAGSELVAETFGVADDPGVLLIDDGARDWRRIAIALAEAGRYVVRLESDRGDEPEAALAAIRAVLASLEARPVLLGAARGALLAAMVAGEAEEYLATGLILIDPPAVSDARRATALAALRQPVLVVASEADAAGVAAHIADAEFVASAASAEFAASDADDALSAVLLDFLERRVPQSPPEYRAGSDQRTLRDALGCFATGVTVVTTRTVDGTPVGLTANSFTSVSLDPPLLLVCIAKSASSLSAFEQARHFAVNVLHIGQQPVSGRFARRGEDRFAGTDVETWDSGVPILSHSLASFECAHEAAHDAGDHVILIGRVERVRFEPRRDPLLYFRGRYRRLHFS